MSNRKNKESNIIETLLENGIYISRWLLVPVYLALCALLFAISIKAIISLIILFSNILNTSISGLLIGILNIIDLALIGNLILIIIFSGYESFISKIAVAKDDDDKPDWMGKISLGDMKIKLMASIVAISGIKLLEAFLSINETNKNNILWMIVIFSIFLFANVLLAFTDFIVVKNRRVKELKIHEQNKTIN